MGEEFRMSTSKTQLRSNKDTSPLRGSTDRAGINLHLLSSHSIANQFFNSEKATLNKLVIQEKQDKTFGLGIKGLAIKTPLKSVWFSRG